MKTKRIKVLVLGQTPPPFGGQAVMIQRMLTLQLPGVEFEHVRLAFSKDMGSMGRLAPMKVLKLGTTIIRTVHARLRTGADVLYYPPAGPQRVPIYRDIVLLLSVRWLFRATVFHFHAAGLGDAYQELGPLGRFLFRRAYFKPDVAIRLSLRNPPDGKTLCAGHDVVVPYGLPDLQTVAGPRDDRRANELRLLYVGLLTESKGVLDAVEAVALLRSSGALATLSLVGDFESIELRDLLLSRISELGLGGCVRIHGVLTGERKESEYEAADVFVFPTFFPSESFGLVLVEAMRHGLPLIGTRWRGVPDLVREGVNGYLVDVGRPDQIAHCAASLLANPGTMFEMSRASRRIFEEEYSEAAFTDAMNAAFLLVDEKRESS